MSKGFIQRHLPKVVFPEVYHKPGTYNIPTIQQEKTLQEKISSNNVPDESLTNNEGVENEG